MAAMDSSIPNDLNATQSPSQVNAPVLLPSLPTPKVPADWRAGNLQYGYNMGHVYGTYDINVESYLEWANGPRSSNFIPEPSSHIKIYVTKADPAKKVVSVVVRTGITDRLIKMFEPMASHFINTIRDQLTNVQQDLVNLLDQGHLPAIVRMPLSANGPIEDTVFNNKRQTELKAIGYSVEVKSDGDAVFPNTIFSNIRFLLSQRQA